MGTVYLGTDASGRQAADKVLRDGHGFDLASPRRFAREIAAVAAIDSPRVATLLDADPVGEQPWLATEYVPGPTLGAAVAQNGPMPADQLHTLATGLAEGLCAVHEAGVVHRDIKPSNVMLAHDGPKIIDFGIVAGLPGTMTESGIVLGSIGFMAPELLINTGQPTAKADVFSWALTVVFASSGRVPFGDGPLEALLHRTLNTEPDLRDLPRNLRGVIVAALRKQPRRRPTARELSAKLLDAPVRTARPQPAGAPEPGTSLTTVPLRPVPALTPLNADNTAPYEPASAGTTTVRLAESRAGRWAASIPAWKSAALLHRRRLVLAVAGGLAALAITANVLVAQMAAGSPTAADAGRAPLPASTPVASPKPASPGATATTTPADTGPPVRVHQAIEAAASQPRAPATVDPPDPRTAPHPSARRPPERNTTRFTRSCGNVRADWALPFLRDWCRRTARR
jgi:serine/threonine protein kinase